MAIKRRVLRYSDEYRAAALKRVADGEIRTAVAKDLNISPSLIDRWKQERDNPKGPTPGKMRHFSDDFKSAAVERIKRGELAEKISKELGIGSSVLSSWKKKVLGKKLSTSARPRPPAPPRNKRKSYYVPVAERVRAMEDGKAEDSGALQRRIHACVGLLRGVRGKIDTNDPVHLTAALVLATLEGKM